MWAAKGFVRFRSQNYTFTPSGAAAQYQREMEDLSSPVRAFVRERCSVGPDHVERISELYAAWADWNEVRRRPPGTEQMFGRDLRAAYPHVKSSQPRESGVRVRVYLGIGLRSRSDWGEDDAAV